MYDRSKKGFMMRFLIFLAAFLSVLSARDFEATVKADGHTLHIGFNKEINGTLHYGLLDERGNIRFYKKTAPVQDGKTSISLSDLSGKYDFSGWGRKGDGAIGYRLVSDGSTLIESSFGFWLRGGNVVIPNGYMTLKPGFVKSSDAAYGAVFETLGEVACEIGGKKESAAQKLHKIEFAADKKISIMCDGYGGEFALPTVKKTDSFSFAFASDSRGANGAGENDLGGVNAGVLKKIFALASKENASFFQFTGDMISGYKNDENRQRLEYYNFKKAAERFASHTPLYAGMGNHEAFIGKPISEKLFSEYFATPKSPLAKEVGDDMPLYADSAYSYTYANTAVIVLNSNYFYNPNLKKELKNGRDGIGGLHGYIMDGQADWLKREMAKYDGDPQIRHVFVTVHTPLFPNGGHSGDAMWYDGENGYRSVTVQNGIRTPAQKGIIERRDEIIEIALSSKKFRAFLSGDEHNYSRTVIKPDTRLHKVGYELPKPNIGRAFTQITNGAAGAPYYGQESMVWSDGVKSFHVRNTLVMIDINGEKACYRAIDADDFETFDKGCF